MEFEHFSSSDEVDYGAGRPALLIGNDPGGLEQPRAMIAEAGLRLVGTSTTTERPIASIARSRSASPGPIWGKPGLPTRWSTS